MSTRRAFASLKPFPSRGGAINRVALLALIPLALLAGCRKSEATDPFPLPDRPVSPIVSPRFSNEDERDRFKEAETVMKLGVPNDPQLPDASFDRIFMIHMYHEIERPSEVLWHLRAALKPGGRIVVVDADRPTDRHGTPPRLLVCEFGAIGYELTRFERLAD